jgi:hypothetical protein
MALPDPVLVCREVLLADPAVTALVEDRVYATPDLPQGHSYPCLRLTHVGTSGHAPVGFRHSASALVQLDAWAAQMRDLHTLAEAALDALTGHPHVPGALSIRPVSEVRELDESAQPPLHRYRTQLTVRIAHIARTT